MISHPKYQAKASNMMNSINVKIGEFTKKINDVNKIKMLTQFQTKSCTICDNLCAFAIKEYDLLKAITETEMLALISDIQITLTKSYQKLLKNEIDDINVLLRHPPNTIHQDLDIAHLALLKEGIIPFYYVPSKQLYDILKQSYLKSTVSFCIYDLDTLVTFEKSRVNPFTTNW